MVPAPEEAAIYHLVLESSFRALLDAEAYRSADLTEVGFVHCASRPSVLPVADDHFTDAPGPLLLLEIDPTKLRSEVRYEAAAPIAGAGRAHLASAPLFPHIYGPVAREAIARVGTVGRGPDGFRWPTRFLELAPFLAEG